MIELLASALIASSNRSEDVNKFCAKVVGIPYASDNFNDEEFSKFELCKRLIIEK
jgi:hypothetical protein